MDTFIDWLMQHPLAAAVFFIVGSLAAIWFWIRDWMRDTKRGGWMTPELEQMRREREEREAAAKAARK